MRLIRALFFITQENAVELNKVYTTVNILLIIEDIMESLERPSVGVATVVVKDGKILIGEDTRKGEAMYGVPGGHWESGESLKECAKREVREESGVDCGNISLISVYDFYREDKKKSYISIGMKAEYATGDLTDLHEEGRLNWSWYSPEEALALNLFAPDKILIERYLSGTIFE